MFDKSVTDLTFFFFFLWSGQLRSSWDTCRIKLRDEALFLLFVTTESVYYSLLDSSSKFHTLLLFHVFISALDFVLNKLCSLQCPFLFYPYAPLASYLGLTIAQQRDGFIYKALDVFGTSGMYLLWTTGKFKAFVFSVERRAHNCVRLQSYRSRNLRRIYWSQSLSAADNQREKLSLDIYFIHITLMSFVGQ